MERKFFRTIVQIEVLSEDEPWAGSVETIGYDVIEGDCSGHMSVVSIEELTGKQAAEALHAQASDPSFFGIDDDGNDIRD